MQSRNNLDLFGKIPLLKKFVMWRGFQFSAILPNLLLFYIFLIAGVWGTPVGNRNIIIVFIWILWWFVLIAAMVPFASRIWCTACPLPFFGEWLQRFSLIKVKLGKTLSYNTRYFGLNRVWPRRFQNIWLQNLGFLTLGIFSVLLVTRPIVTAGVLGGFIILAIALGFIFRLRTFCMYLCPVSGFLSLYAMTSKVALRVKDPVICEQHREKECLLGGEGGYGCPWFQYLGKMDRNNYCGLCGECVKACPKDNIGLYWRKFCGDIEIRGLDESWKAFIMLALALTYSVTLLGPWGIFKDWGNFTESGNWRGFLVSAAASTLLALVIVPVFHYIAVLISRWFTQTTEISVKEYFIKYSYVLVPFGLLAWVAFSIPLIMVNGSYIIQVMSDPFGWGWNLFGTANFPWIPFLPEWIPYLQIVVLLLGLYTSIESGYRVGELIFKDKKRIIRGLVPFAVLVTLITIAFLKLFVG